MRGIGGAGGRYGGEKRDGVSERERERERERRRKGERELGHRAIDAFGRNRTLSRPFPLPPALAIPLVLFHPPFRPFERAPAALVGSAEPFRDLRTAVGPLAQWCNGNPAFAETLSRRTWRRPCTCMHTYACTYTGMRTQRS